MHKYDLDRILYVLGVYTINERTFYDSRFLRTIKYTHQSYNQVKIFSRIHPLCLEHPKVSG